MEEHQREGERWGERAPLGQNQDFLPRQSCDGDNITDYCYPHVILHRYLLSQAVICLEPTKVGVCNRICGGVNKRGATSEVSAVHIVSSIDCVYSSFSLQTIIEVWGTHPGLTAG